MSTPDTLELATSLHTWKSYQVTNLSATREVTRYSKRRRDELVIKWTNAHRHHFITGSGAVVMTANVFLSSRSLWKQHERQLLRVFLQFCCRLMPGLSHRPSLVGRVTLLCGGSLHRSADCLSDFTSVLYQTTIWKSTTLLLLLLMWFYMLLGFFYFQYIQDVPFKMRYSPCGKRNNYPDKLIDGIRIK